MILKTEVQQKANVKKKTLKRTFSQRRSSIRISTIQIVSQYE